MQKFVHAAPDGDWFVHPFVREKLPVERDGPVRDEIKAYADDFVARLAAEQWFEAAKMITDTHRPTWIKEFIEPLIPCDARGDIKFWKMLKQAWTSSGLTDGVSENWAQLFSAPRSNSASLMTCSERRWLAARGSTLKLWRGLGAHDAQEAEGFARRGLAWTIYRETAEWFAERGANWGYRPHRFVACTSVPIGLVTAFFGENGEGEVILANGLPGEYLVEIVPGSTGTEWLRSCHDWKADIALKE
ncbi:MAG: hypothetical protein PHX82_02040 [Paracoccaceae bacterium]|nr:hypothetical protein [Paracoccaceae bacterium]